MPQAVFISTLFCLKKCYSRSHTRVGEKKLKRTLYCIPPYYLLIIMFVYLNEFE